MLFGSKSGLRERNLLSTVDSTLAEGEYFGPMLENGQVTPFKVSVDLFMDRVDEWRRDELYPHSCTSYECEKRG